MKENIKLKRLLSVILTVVMVVNMIVIAEPIGRARAAETVNIYSEDFETGAVLTSHAGSGYQENRLQTNTNSCLELTGFSAAQLATPEIKVEENTEYILSYRVKATNVSGNFYFYSLGQEWDDFGSYGSLAAAPDAIQTATDGWQKVEGTYTFSKNHVQFFFEEAWGGSADICLDDIALTNTTTGEIVYLESFDTTQSLAVRWGTPTQTQAKEELPAYYLQLTGASGYCVKTEGISIEANTEYILSYRVKVENVRGAVYFYTWRQEWDDGGNYSGVLPVAEGITVATDGWQTVEVRFTSDKNHVQIFLEQAWGGSADICVDDISLKAADSESTAYAEDFTTRQALTVHSTGTGGSQSFVQDGNRYLALLGASGYSVKTDGISIEAGTEYTLSYQVKMENASGSVYFYALRQEWDDRGNYSNLLTTTDGITAATDGWQTVEVSFTSEKNHLQFFFEQAWGGNADIYLDNIQLTKVIEEPTTEEPTTEEPTTEEPTTEEPTTEEPTTEEPTTEAQPSIMQTSLHFNRVQEGAWYLDAANIGEVTGQYYFAVVSVDGNGQKIVFEKTDTGFVIFENFFTVYGGASAPQSSFQIPEGTVLYQFDPNENWNDAVSGGQHIEITETLSVEAVGDGWSDGTEEPAGPAEPTEPATEAQPSIMQTSLHFNRVQEGAWYLDAANIGEVTGQYYFAVVSVDGNGQKIVFEKTDTGFVIFENFFTVYGGASAPQSSFQIPEGTVLYRFDPNESWNDAVSGGQHIEITETLSVEAIDGGWYEHNASVENTKTLDFAQYDYTTVEIGGEGWLTGSTTLDVCISDGIICGQTGDASDANVLTLTDSAVANQFVLEAGTQYRFSVTYKSTASLMFFCNDWISVCEKPMAASEWTTISVTFVAENSGKLPIYVQNWGGEQPEGEFRIKDMYIAKVTDTKTVTEGEPIGILPDIDRIPSDSGYKFVWGIKNQDTETYTYITDETVYDSRTVGKVVYATSVKTPHSTKTHWWTREGASVTEHICSECDARQKHSYEGDICTVCQYDMGQALHFALFDYTSVDIGQGGWETGATTCDLKVADGVISGKTGEAANNAVLSLYSNSDLNSFVMKAGETYRISLTYRSEVKLMFFCDEWISFTKEAAAAEDWETITVTITPDASRKLALYIQNWDDIHSDGEFQIKNIFISNISDSREPLDGGPIGAFPEIGYASSDEFHNLVWRIENKEGNDYITVTPQTIYDSNTMGRNVIAGEIKVYHSILNYVCCDLTAVDSWTTGSAMKSGSYALENGIVHGVVCSNSNGQTLMSFGDGAGRLALEPGVEYKVILTYKSEVSFGLFVNLKSNEWTEAPGKCLPSSGNEWKTVTATFKPTAGDTFNGVLIQSWNDGKEYSFQIKDFCIARAGDTKRFAGNEKIGQIPACERENDPLNRYVYQWVVYKENGETLALSNDVSIESITSALNETGMLYAYEKMQCLYHMGEENAKAATCTQEGWGPYWACRNCGKCFSDIMCREEITDLEVWKTGEGRAEPAGHILSTSVLSPDGNVYYYCVCGKLFKLEGDTCVEVPVAVLDNAGKNQEEDPIVLDVESNSKILWLVISCIVLVAAGTAAVLYFRRRKRKTA